MTIYLRTLYGSKEMSLLNGTTVHINSCNIDICRTHHL